MCKQVMQQSVESKVAAEACLASDLYHGIEEDIEYQWGDLSSRR